MKLLFLAVGLWASSFLAACAQGNLTELNDRFRLLYSDAKAEVRKIIGPVIIMIEDRLVLLDGGKRQESVIIPSTYTSRKVIDHIPLAIFVSLLSHANGEPLPDEVTNKLITFRTMVEQEQKQVSAQGFESSSARQEDLVQKSLQFLNKVLADKKVAKADLHAFTRSVGPAALENVGEASAFQLRQIDQTVSKWRSQLGDKWKYVYVVVLSGHMPREKNLAMQYFLKALGEKAEGQRVVYGESLSTEEAGLDLLATHIVDREIGIAFFKDPWRMHRDLLSDGAERYLRKNPPLTKYGAGN